MTMPLTDNAIFPWQTSIWSNLNAYKQTQRIPQALLLTGNMGLGKRHLANIYAASLLCEKPEPTGFSCQQCLPCNLFAAQTHPDFIRIELEDSGKIIGVDKIRQLIAKLALKPLYDNHRIVIFDPAEALNVAAANAFLKCLEEPTERTCFILITEQPGKLPATIRSRCQKIHILPPSTQISSNWLQAQGVTENVEQLLMMSQGAPLLAKKYADEQILPLRVDFFNAWQQIALANANPLLVAESWYKQEKIDHTVLISWLSSWIMDMVKLRHCSDNHVINNVDFKKILQLLSERLGLKSLYHYYDTLLNSRALLASQVNRQLLIERLLIDWAQLNKL